MAAQLPQDVRQMLADPGMRGHHQNWHLVRRPEIVAQLSPETQAALRAQGWVAPRAQGEQGAGTDFLFMHQQMINHVNGMLAGRAAYPRVVGWTSIPGPDDPDWPVPPVWPSASPSYATAKSDDSFQGYRSLAKDRYQNTAWLHDQTLDALGTEIEQDIHGWMHLRWSSDPWYPGYKQQPPGDRGEDDIRNDFLGHFYSSHVNDAFWKLHGWIDDRISSWEKATGKTADWTGAWEGPSQLHHMTGVLRMKKATRTGRITIPPRIQQQLLETLWRPRIAGT